SPAKNGFRLPPPQRACRSLMADGFSEYGKFADKKEIINSMAEKKFKGIISSGFRSQGSGFLSQSD
ncbi:MAG: hypothetical protein KAJ60_04050, partial [Desulfobulbaceae bacterium]|nr:hypothetical protein [Desulfobulbaceae bacterium]